MKKCCLISFIIMAFVITVMVIIFNIITEKKELHLTDIKLGKKVTSAEKAITIAKEYNNKWDSRAAIESLLIKYLNKNDLINDMPEFVIWAGYNNKYNWLRDVYTTTTIRDDTLDFHAVSTPGLGIIGVKIDENLHFPTSDEIIDILDLSTVTTNVNWRELNDFLLVVYPYKNGLNIRIVHNIDELEFYYNLHSKEITIEKNGIVD